MRSEGLSRVSVEEARAILESCGAILHGHFRLTSGRHSDLYVQKARIIERPQATLRLAGEIASWYSEGLDAVVAPAVGAIPLGFAVAAVSGARSIFAEREEGVMRLRRGFALQAGERALVVEDVITTGGTAGEVFELVRRSPAEPAGVAALVDRSNEPPSFPLRAVVRVEARSWTAEACPLCRAGAPLDDPGSRHP